MATAKKTADDASTGEEQSADTRQMGVMEAHFAAQPKVTVKCREDQWVQVNGYTFVIQKDVKVEVPQQIAEILEESGRI